MISNFWEEQNMSEIAMWHEEALSEMGIPKWLQINCPFCQKKLPLRSIRSFGVKLNSRNFCDLFVEVCCDKCSKMDTIYFRQEIEKITDFIGFLTGESSPVSEPITEQDMFDLKRNNLVERKMSKELA